MYKLKIIPMKVNPLGKDNEVINFERQLSNRLQQVRHEL